MAYKIQSGDTLSGIAQQQGTTIAELQKLNPQITNPNLIYTGQSLAIPADSLQGSTKPADVSTYTDPNADKYAEIASGLNSVQAQLLQFQKDQQAQQSQESETPKWMEDWLSKVSETKPEPTAPMWQQSQQDTGVLDLQKQEAEDYKAVKSKQAELSGITAEIQGLIDENKAKQMQLRKEGISAGAITGRSIADERQLAIRALPLQSKALAKQAEIASAQGNLEYSQRLLDRATENMNTLFKLKSDDATNQYNYQVKMLDAVYQVADKVDQRRLDAKKAQLTQDNADRVNNLNQAQTWATTAISQGQGDLAAQIMALDPKDPQYQTKLGQLAGQIKMKEKVTTTDATGASTTPMSILDVQRYQELYPDAGITAGDSEATANAKVAALNQPKVFTTEELTTAITEDKNAKTSYEDVIAGIDSNALIQNKDEAKKIAAQVYGKKVEQPSFGAGNFKTIPINDRIAELKKVLGLTATKSYLQQELLNEGYPKDAIFNATANMGEKLLNNITNFLFGKK